MPSQFSSSFASAAAGNASGDGSNSRARDARANGSTTTFRRPSLATNLSHQREASQGNASATNQNSGVYVPPHMSANAQTSQYRNGAADTRYSKDQLLDIFRAQSRTNPAGPPISNLYVDGWNPHPSKGMTNGGWSAKDGHEHGLMGSDICWDQDGKVQPLGLVDMTEQEKEIFSTSVNSPIRPPAQNTNKEGTQNASVLGRRTSITHTQNANSYNASSPTTRPGNRRRESTDFPQNNVTSPSNSRFAKDENTATPPPALLRRRTDFKENTHSSTTEERGDKKVGDNSSPFGSLKRTATGPVSTSFGASSSPWSAAPQSAGFSPMGAFGNFSMGASTAQTQTPSEKKSTYGSLRGESRFKGLMNADSSEDMGAKVKEKASVGSLERLAESSNEPMAAGWGTARPGQAAGAVARHEEPYQAGSAALGGDDASPPPQSASRFGFSNPSGSREDMGFSSFGGTTDVASFRELMQRRETSQSQMAHGKPQGLPGNEPMSPTTTNPYQSPEAEKAIPRDTDADELDYRSSHMGPGTGFGHPARTHTSQVEGIAGDQSRTSSAGASRAFPHLGSLGGLAGLGGSSTWSAAPGAVGTPSSAMPGSATAFGHSAFGGLDELTSPIHGVSGGSGIFGGPSNVGAFGRGSKMGSLFPSAMQDQMKNDQPPSNINDYQQSGFGSMNVMNANTSLRSRGNLDDMLGNVDIGNRNNLGLSSPTIPNESTPLGTAQISQPSQTSLPSAFAGTPSLAAASNTAYFPKQQDLDAQSADQIPATQQRQMVMPDRMRWIYRDPQGNTQGPWSGLEMHDWYKAGFFSPELQVRKEEDKNYEPLAQLIRRIGNSREPFLVPQIGIPHGGSTAIPTPSAQASSTMSSATAVSSSAQPPFASSFPSFGTTLTAEQQNALERRKQEEQYLMARQKEHLAQQQVMIKQQMQHVPSGPHGMHSQQLHHHSSAHSLQSQPSYGSITSPTQGSIQPPSAMTNYFDAGRTAGQNTMSMGPSSEHLPPLREDDLSSLMERLNAQHRAAPSSYAAPSQPPLHQDEAMHQRQVHYMLQERQRLQREQEEYGMMTQGTDEARQAAERFEQFKYLRSQGEDQLTPQQSMPPIGPAQRISDPQLQTEGLIGDEDTPEASADTSFHRAREPLSLSEQVQKAVKESPAVQPQSPWARVESGLPQPFPPPQSSSPLPAPAAQRNRQNVADALNAESRSATHTPSTDTPSATMAAPWAKETTESAKGPSLKEIQAVEARKAAQQEETALAARRQLLEQERLAQQNQQVAPAPGLPSSANWANSISPAVPGGSASAWAKPSVNKAAIATPVPSAKKTLDQIQKEEEARKKRAAASAAAAVSTTNTNASNAAAAALGGKRYADLAGKTPQINAAQAQGNQAWTTVGAGGKVKTPTVPTPAPVRAPSASQALPNPNTPAAAKAKPAGKTVDKQNAQQELERWMKGALSKGLNAGIPVDDFTSQLLLLPAEPDIISDSIYSASQTLDGRRFAEEFVRRRKLADKGMVPDAGANGMGNGFGVAGSASKDEGKG
ncbi:MAG: hypothetical protein Q9174_004169, partial [Haloplaca sp. 1 TL-2023]